MFRKLTLKMKGVMESPTLPQPTTPTSSTAPTPFRKDYKIILVGDSQCGKSALLNRYTKRTFSENYVPTVFDSGSAEIVSDQNNEIKLNIWDTSGSSEFDHIRPLSYNEAAAFLLCFDLEKPTASLENIRNKWLPEIKNIYPDTPIVLVGCKSDLRSDSKSSSHKNTDAITCHQGMNFSKEIGAVGYLECSSKNQVHTSKIDKLFEVTAILATGQLAKVPKEMRPRDQTNKKAAPSCSIM